VLRRRTRIDGDAISFRRVTDTTVAEVEPGAVDEILAVESKYSLSEHTICGRVAGRGRERCHQNYSGQ